MRRLAFVLLIALAALPALGQNGGNGGGGGGGGGGGFGGPGGMQISPAMIQQFISRYQQRQLDNIKTQLGSTDDEFAALQPYVQKVIDLQTSIQIGRFSGFRIGGQSIGAMMAGAGQQPSDLQLAVTALQTALDDQTSTPQLISVKLQDLRAAREKAQEDLKTAQGALRDLLTQRQEAILVWMGYLE